MKHNQSTNPLRMTATLTQRRTNQQWLSELKGRSATVYQRSALDDLAQYLHVVAHNALQKRRRQFLRLRVMDDESLAELTRDFVQEVMIKLTSRNFQLLDSYEGRGKFTSWAAQIINNEIASEFRKVSWNRVRPISNYSDNQLADSNVPSPEAVVVNNCMYETLNSIIAELPAKLRVPLVRCILQEERAATVAADMGITANAVYSLVHRAKKTLHEQLDTAGYKSL